MFKVALLTLALFSAVLAETTFEEVPAGTRSSVVPKPGEVVSRAEGYSTGNGHTFAVPNDAGGNWGDNIWGKRVSGDRLISREIQLNTKSAAEQEFKWTANFPNTKITHIRVLNIGRERAFVSAVSASDAGGPTATGLIQIAPNKVFRLLIEVYVK